MTDDCPNGWNEYERRALAELGGECRPSRGAERRTVASARAQGLIAPARHDGMRWLRAAMLLLAFGAVFVLGVEVGGRARSGGGGVAAPSAEPPAIVPAVQRTAFHLDADQDLDTPCCHTVRGAHTSSCTGLRKVAYLGDAY